MGCCASAHKKELESQVLELQTQTQDARVAVKRLRTKEIELTKELSVRGDRMAALVLESSRLEAELASGAAQRAALEAQVSAARRAHAEVGARAEETTRELSEERATSASLRAELADATARAREAASELARERSEHAGVRRSLRDEVAHERAASKSALRRSATQATLLRTTNTKIVKKLGDMRSRNKELGAMIAAVKDDYQRLIRFCLDPKTVDALVRRVCVRDTPAHELIRYKKLAGAVLRALARSEQERQRQAKDGTAASLLAAARDARRAPRPPERRHGGRDEPERTPGDDDDDDDGSDVDDDSPTVVEATRDWLTSLFE